MTPAEDNVSRNPKQNTSSVRGIWISASFSQRLLSLRGFETNTFSRPYRDFPRKIKWLRFHSSSHPVISRREKTLPISLTTTRDKNTRFEKLVSITTDGAANMVGKYN